MKRRRKTIVFGLGLFAAAISVYCADPIPDRKVEAQGEELDGYPVGEFHRPGSNCTACHKEDGEAAESIFTVAGTIFAAPTSLTGVEGAEVQLTDSVGTTYIAATNCVGNFFVKPDQWDPKFPILVRVRKGQAAILMNSPIGRERSCGGCHLNRKLTEAQERAFMPHIALFGGDEPNGGPAADSGCRADANVPGYIP